MSLFSGKKLHILGTQTLINFEPSHSNNPDLNIVDFSINNGWVRSGSHWFLLHNNAKQPCSKFLITLEPKKIDSPSINYRHLGENVIAHEDRPIPPRAFRYIYGDLCWKTFGHHLSELKLGSFNIEPSPFDHDESFQLHLNHMQKRTHRRVLNARAAYGESGTAVWVKLQNQSEVTLYQADISLSVHLPTSDYNTQHIFVGTLTETENLSVIEPGQIGIAKFIYDKNFERFEEELGFLCTSEAFPLTDDKDSSDSNSGSKLLWASSNIYFTTMPNDQVIPEVDQNTLQKIQIAINQKIEEIVQTGIFRLAQKRENFIVFTCVACRKKTTVSQDVLLSNKQINCQECALRANQLRSVEFKTPVPYTRGNEIPVPKIEENLFYNDPKQRLDVQCILCEHIDEVSVNLLVRKSWTCPGCPVH